MRSRFSILLGSMVLSSSLYAQMTIVTYNIANYNDHPDWAARINLLVDAIEKAKADVVVLQEIRFNPDEGSSKMTYENTAEQILRLLNARGDFIHANLVTQPIMFYPMSNKSRHDYVLPASLSADTKSYLWEGISIISKPNILETGSAFLSNNGCEDSNKRATQYVKISQNGKPLYIVNVHFAFTQDCITRNAQETLQYLNHFDPNIGIIMVGDMNAEPTNVALKTFTDAGFVDSWAAINPGSSGYTFPSIGPSKRIDYIWLNAIAAQGLSNGSKMTIIGADSTDGIYPSDHLGLTLTLPNF